jgi:hypothetical protein
VQASVSLPQTPVSAMGTLPVLANVWNQVSQLNFCCLSIDQLFISLEFAI